jgi:hypothetical protein
MKPYLAIVSEREEKPKENYAKRTRTRNIKD